MAVEEVELVFLLLDEYAAVAFHRPGPFYFFGVVVFRLAEGSTTLTGKLSIYFFFLAGPTTSARTRNRNGGARSGRASGNTSPIGTMSRATARAARSSTTGTRIMALPSTISTATRVVEKSTTRTKKITHLPRTTSPPSATNTAKSTRMRRRNLIRSTNRPSPVVELLTKTATGAERAPTRRSIVVRRLPPP